MTMIGDDGEIFEYEPVLSWDELCDQAARDGRDTLRLYHGELYEES